MEFYDQDGKTRDENGAILFLAHGTNFATSAVGAKYELVPHVHAHYRAFAART